MAETALFMASLLVPVILGSAVYRLLLRRRAPRKWAVLLGFTTGLVMCVLMSLVPWDPGLLVVSPLFGLFVGAITFFLYPFHLRTSAGKHRS